MILFTAFATSPGNTYPENQDAVLIGDEVYQGQHEGKAVFDAPRILLGVADGVAASPCAARASRVAMELLAEAYGSGAPLSEHLLRIVQARMIEIAGDRCRGMACTLAAISLHGARGTVVHAGDCRVYRYRENQLQPLTEDHTVLRRMIREGLVEPEQASQVGAAYLDPDSALVADPYEDDFEVGVRELDMREGDLLILASDGLTAMLDDDRSAALVSDESRSLLDRARRLVKRAMRDPDNDDNVSVVLVHVGRD